MSLGQGIGELWEAVRDRVEVSGHEPVWHVTAGSFDAALDYARERFEAPVVLDRSDRSRWWPRVTLTVTTDAAMAEAAPPLDELAAPAVPVQREPEPKSSAPTVTTLPPALEEIFAHQEQRRLAARTSPRP
jgi:hypothetical protein